MKYSWFKKCFFFLIVRVFKLKKYADNKYFITSGLSATWKQLLKLLDF